MTANATGFFQIDTYRAHATELPHDIEYVATVFYRLSPNEPRCAHSRTFSSIARTEEMAIHWVNRQVKQWETEQKDAARREQRRQEQERYRREEVALLEKMRGARL